MKRIIFILIIMVGLVYAQPVDKQNNIITKNIDEMKKILYKEYKSKRKYIKREYSNSHTTYFELIEYENHPSLDFSFPIPKDKVKDRYVKVTYSNKIPVEMEEYDRDNQQYNSISYLDKYMKVTESYYSKYDYVIINYNLDESIDAISCKNKLNKKTCTIHRTLSQDKGVINSTHGVMMYSAYPNEKITGREYLERIRIKRGEDYFNALLKEEQSFVSHQIKYYQNYKLKNKSIQFLKVTSPIQDNKYIKVFYQKEKCIKAQWYDNNELKKSITFNKKGQINEFIDFNFRSIKEYKYGRKDNSIDEIECLYLKGTCSVKLNSTPLSFNLHFYDIIRQKEERTHANKTKNRYSRLSSYHEPWC